MAYKLKIKLHNVIDYNKVLFCFCYILNTNSKHITLTCPSQTLCHKYDTRICAT